MNFGKTGSTWIDRIYSIELTQLNKLNCIYSIQSTQLNLLNWIYSIESTQSNLLNQIYFIKSTWSHSGLTTGNPESYHFDDQQPRILLFWQPATQNDLVWQPATQNLIVLKTGNPESYCFDDFQLKMIWFGDRQPRISLFWQLATQNLIILTTGNSESYRFGDWQLKMIWFDNHLIWVQVATLTNQKNNVENSTIKLLKRYSQPNNREKRLPEPLDAWKPGWTFYSVVFCYIHNIRLDRVTHLN